MAESSYPFDNTAIATELQWSRMMRLLGSDGVETTPGADDLSATKTASLSVTVAPGAAWIRGFYYTTDTPKVIGLPANTTTNPRIDLIVLRVNWTTNAMTSDYVQGTPAATPTPPAVTRNEGLGVYEIPLAEARVEAGGAISTVADRRRTLGKPVLWCSSDNHPDPEGIPTLAYETNNRRVMFTGGDGTWEPLPGVAYRPQYVFSGDAGNTTSTSWVQSLTNTADATMDDTFTAPPSGIVIIRSGAYLYNGSSNGESHIAIRLHNDTLNSYVWDVNSGTDADRGLHLDLPSATGGGGASCAGVWRATGLSPGYTYTISQWYRVAATGQTGEFDDRYIETQPIP